MEKNKDLGWLNFFRLLPDFFIIGAQKSGTTSLHHYLSAHPYIRTPLIKEVHFFDENFFNGTDWYREHFPTFLPKYKAKIFQGKSFLYGEATPYYLFHPLVPERIFNTCPKARFIVLLKNPIDRAYSHYQHERKRGFEPLETFEEAIEAEAQRLAGEKEKIINLENYNSFQYMHFSYLNRGHYAEQIQRWFEFFPRERFLIMEAEYFYSNTLFAFKEILDFLGLEDWKNINFKKYNVNKYSPVSGQTKDKLNAYFKAHNQELCDLLSQKFSWA